MSIQHSYSLQLIPAKLKNENNMTNFYFLSNCLFFLTYKGFNKYIEIIVTTCKRSLGQGNVFTPVYDSVHGGGEVVCITPWARPLGHTPRVGRHPPGRHLLGRPLGKHPRGQTLPTPGRHPSWRTLLGRHPPEQTAPPP